MESLLGQGLLFARFLAQHMVVMMYWVWIPGLFISAFVALRYREMAAQRVRESTGASLRSLLWGTLLGVTLTPDRRRSMESLLNFFREGLHPATAFAVYLSSRNLVLYFLAIWMLLLGIEFAVGQVVGALAMIALVAAGVRYAVPDVEWERIRERLQNHPPAEVTRQEEEDVSWRGLLLSSRGWGRSLRYIGREGRHFVLPLAAGLLIGGFILASGLQSWWVELGSVGGEGVLTDVLNALAAPALSLVAAIGPVGSLPVASNLFKAYTLAYPGLVAFVLAGALKPQDISALVRAFGGRVALRLTILLYVSAAVGGLIATGVFAIFGFRPGHVPLFREIVDAFIMWLPFTMPGMKMPGMGGM